MVLCRCKVVVLPQAGALMCQCDGSSTVTCCVGNSCVAAVETQQCSTWYGTGNVYRALRWTASFQHHLRWRYNIQAPVYSLYASCR